jgi:hypothetical protein
MYLIEPYKSIGKLNLNSNPSEIEKILGEAEMKSSEYAPGYITGHYINGITVSYNENSACYIGVIISLFPVHLNFSFSNKSYQEVLNYFKQYPGDIYSEGGDTSLVSEFLGISAYFEDGIKEAAVFSKNYFKSLISTFEKI